MAETTVIPRKERRLAALRGALREGSWRGAARMIGAMHPAEIATLMESLPPAQREVVWNFVEPEIEGDVLVELSDEVRQSFIDGMDAEELLAAAEDMELDDLADLVGDLPEAVRNADIIVAAVGSPHLVQADWVTPGAAVLDVGVTRTGTTSAGRARLSGDVDPRVAEVAGWLSPNPGGVGPMTRAMLVANVVASAERHAGVKPPAGPSSVA